MDQSAELPISRFPVPALADMPSDIRERLLAVQEKSGFIPNVFLVLAHRPDEFRVFRLPRRTHGKARKPNEGRA